MLSLPPHFANSLSPAGSVRGLRALAGIAARRSDRGGRLRLAVAEIDQRRHRIEHRLRRALLGERRRRAGSPPDRASA